MGFVPLQRLRRGDAVMAVTADRRARIIDGSILEVASYTKRLEELMATSPGSEGCGKNGNLPDLFIQQRREEQGGSG